MVTTPHEQNTALHKNGNVAAPIDREQLQAEFVERLRQRWARGAREYGDRSFTRPLPETAEQILEEIEDVAGWSLIAWQQVRERLQHVEDRAAALAAMQLRMEQLRAERDALAARLHAIAETLAGAGDCPTWAALAGLVAKAAMLAEGVGQ